jgi:hypothetical protein
MENAKKMILVDPVRASQLYRPTICDKKLSNLDENITKILRSNLPADEKAKRYASSLKQLKYYDKPVVAKTDPDNDILGSVQPLLRRKAKRLLKRVKPHVTLRDDGEIVHNANLIPHSDISELLNDTLTKRSEEIPVGWVEFADVLKRARTPRSLIVNEKLRKYMNPRSKKTIEKRKWEEFN